MEVVRRFDSGAAMNVVQAPVAADQPKTQEPSALFRWRVPIVCIGLIILVAVAFAPVLHNDFIRLDDNQYICENPHVATGLTLGNVKWAFQAGYASNWH